jgi:hypothetical protein
VEREREKDLKIESSVVDVKEDFHKFDSRFVRERERERERKLNEVIRSDADVFEEAMSA